MERNQRKSFIFESVYALRLGIFFTFPSCSTNHCYISALHGVGGNCKYGEDWLRNAQKDLYDRYNLADDTCPTTSFGTSTSIGWLRQHSATRKSRLQAYEIRIRVMTSLFQLEGLHDYPLCTQCELATIILENFDEHRMNQRSCSMLGYIRIFTKKV
jgi:hypothetical protein